MCVRVRVCVRECVFRISLFLSLPLSVITHNVRDVQDLSGYLFNHKQDPDGRIRLDFVSFSRKNAAVSDELLTR